MTKPNINFSHASSSFSIASINFFLFVFNGSLSSIFAVPSLFHSKFKLDPERGKHSKIVWEGTIVAIGENSSQQT